MRSVKKEAGCKISVSINSYGSDILVGGVLAYNGNLFFSVHGEAAVGLIFHEGAHGSVPSKSTL